MPPHPLQEKVLSLQKAQRDQPQVRSCLPPHHQHLPLYASAMLHCWSLPASGTFLISMSSFMQPLLPGVLPTLLVRHTATCPFQQCAGKCLTSGSPGQKKPGSGVLSDFCGVNTFAMSQFQAINEVTEWELVGDMHNWGPALTHHRLQIPSSGKSGLCLPLGFHSSWAFSLTSSSCLVH